ncbi:hypothetical protein HanPI659440_Chr08g0292211 [Helianthus annuus]|nr:hypothetical protein HanPI659440_Chr08g0292211 [Helianthus annuus]
MVPKNEATEEPLADSPTSVLEDEVAVMISWCVFHTVLFVFTSYWLQRVTISLNLGGSSIFSERWRLLEGFACDDVWFLFAFDGTIETLELLQSIGTFNLYK